eukprot:TRINITY_DN834_c0_g1_i1.p1 TRINITY_DN834_c0_g1~~TRINITY_DN834_c0_g1_i1.p1  ORF type:complete len:803 (+),score=266.01 TRINITY_DN834_c0_g1_i1:181-2589(+)
MQEIDTNQIGFHGKGASQWTGLEYYRTFYNFCPVPMGICIACPDDMLNVECNAAAASYFCLPSDKVRGRTSSSMGAPLDCIRQWLGAYQYSREKQTPCSFVYSAPCVGGEDKYFNCTIIPVNDYEHHFAYIINDVTKLKYAELKASSLQKKLETIVNSVDSVVWEVDPKTSRFTFVSEQSKSILGIEPREWYSKSFDSFFDLLLLPSDRPSLPDLQTIFRDGKREVVLRINANKEESYAKMTFTISDASDGCPTIIGNIQKVSQTSNIAELTSQEEVKLKMKYKKQITNEITTEIRGPLNHLIGTLAILQESVDHQDNNFSGLFQNAINCAFSFQSSLDGVLDEVKCDNEFYSTNENEAVLINVKKIIEETSNTLSIKAEEKGIDLVSLYPSDLPELYLGSGSIYIRQTIVHLLDLAIKSTDSGQISIWLEQKYGVVPNIIIAFPYVESALNILLRSLEEPLDSLLHDDGIGLNLLLCRMSAQAIGGELKITHKDSVIFMCCSLKIQPHEQPETLASSHSFHPSIVQGKTIWSTLPVESVINLPLWNRLKVWNANAQFVSIEHITQKLARRENVDVIIVEDGEVSEIKKSCGNIPIIVVARYSYFKHRNEENSQIINLFRPINSTKLEFALETAFNDEDDIYFDNDDQILISNDPVRKMSDFKGRSQAKMKPNVLVIDQNEISQKTLSIFLQQQEFNSKTTNDAAGALDILNKRDAKYDMILVDLSKNYKGQHPIEAIKNWQRNHPREKSLICGITSGRQEIIEGEELDGIITKPVRATHLRDAYEKFMSSSMFSSYGIERV